MPWRVLFLLGVLLSTCEIVRGTQYEVTLLHSDHIHESYLNSTSVGQHVGYCYYLSDEENQHAILWDLGTTIDLQPSGIKHSRGEAVSEGRQFGHGTGTRTGNRPHALMWSGSASSAVDLHPSWLSFSYGHGISGGQQVGYGGGGVVGSTQHAIIWRNSAASAVDIHPSGFTASYAFDTSGTQQVGGGQVDDERHEHYWHALLWTGSAESVVDLHPCGYESSCGYCIFGDKQLGYGVDSITEQPHALLWEASADRIVDLHPCGFDSSYGRGISGRFQVGEGRGAATAGNDHALLWEGTHTSVIDLHQFLPEEYTNSYASDIDANGNIVGYAWSSIGSESHGIVWRPIIKQIDLEYPVGAESFIAGDTCTITWQTNDPTISKVLIDYSLDDGLNWLPAAVSPVNNVDVYDWVTPVTASEDCLLRVYDAEDANTYDTSDSVFSLIQFEEGVNLPDPNLKACVEAALGVSNPSTADMLNLTYLPAANRGINDLTGLHHARNLAELSLGGNSISDLEELSDLKKLTHLNLDNNNITSISRLSEMRRLQELSLCDNQITEITKHDVSEYKDLSVLKLRGNELSAISGLSDLCSLTVLELDDNLISDISAIWRLPRLKRLTLRGNPLNTESYCTYLSLIREKKPCVDLDYHWNPSAITSSHFAGFSAFALHWLEPNCGPENSWCGGVELNRTNGVNFEDLQILCECWLSTQGMGSPPYKTGTKNVGVVRADQPYLYLRTVPAGDINKNRILNFLDLCIVPDHWMAELD